MKRVRALTSPPLGLSSYLQDETAPDYAAFRSYDGGAAYRQLVAQLVALQHSLCAYCEVNVTETDRQIEHIRPRSRYPDASLDVANLVACCRGGTVNVTDEDRYFRPQRRNISCRQAKGNGNIPIDPRTLPALPSLLAVRYDGRIEADTQACQSAQTAADVEETIKVLGLNVERLRRARERRWRHLMDIWHLLLGDALVMSEAARRELLPSPDGRLREFFTTRRSFFGKYGEEILAVTPRDWL